MRTAPALLLLAFAWPAFADTVTIPSTRDNTLYESATGSVSNGAGPTMFVGRNASASNFRRRALVRFDVASAVPAGSTITAATLTLNLSQAASPGGQPVELHALLADWGEGASNAGASGGAGAAATAGDATWIHRSFNTVLWTNAGGDFDPVASASQTVGVEGSYSWSGPGLTADAQSKLDAPAANFGWLIHGNEAASQSVKRFDTREAVTESARPLLELQFTPPGTPASGVTWGRIRARYR
jgi:hypothetical protein